MLWMPNCGRGDEEADLAPRLQAGKVGQAEGAAWSPGSAIASLEQGMGVGGPPLSACFLSVS